MNEEASKKVIEIAKRFFDFLEGENLSWQKAFFRFYANEHQIGSACSYCSGKDVELVGSLKARDFFREMNHLFSELRNLTSSNNKFFFVALLIVDEGFGYDIKFEYDDSTKWEINKMNGATGIPEGYQSK